MFAIGGFDFDFQALLMRLDSHTEKLFYSKEVFLMRKSKFYAVWAVLAMLCFVLLSGGCVSVDDFVDDYEDEGLPSAGQFNGTWTPDWGSEFYPKIILSNFTFVNDGYGIRVNVTIGDHALGTLSFTERGGYGVYEYGSDTPPRHFLRFASEGEYSEMIVTAYFDFDDGTDLDIEEVRYIKSSSSTR
jgi:hypothetical protein